MIIQNINDYGELLDNPKLLKVKDEGDYLVAKYGNKVFWDNLWEQYPILKQARGHVFEKSTGNIVTRPFTKVFNYGENGAGLDIPPEAPVISVEKINGFLGVVTCLTNGERLYSTTGTLSSDYADLVEKHCKGLDFMVPEKYPVTYMFEICDESDPHIIKEELGCHLIGMSNTDNGEVVDETTLNCIAHALGCHRPNWKISKFKDVLEELKTCNHEGFMIRDVDTGEYLCKLKSPYYLFTKFLARLRKEDKLRNVWDDNEMIQERYGEEYVDIFARLRDNLSVEEFLVTPEQERIDIIKGVI